MTRGCFALGILIPGFLILMGMFFVLQAWFGSESVLLKPGSIQLLIGIVAYSLFC
jgi:hypothetical protein